MITLRPANESDSQTLYAWRNDPLTRENSRNTDLVPWEGHVRWLTGTLVNPGRELWIAESDGKPVGQLRYDLDNKKVELSWTVAPEARGKGHGKAMVRAALRHRRWPMRKVIAEIKPGNEASRKLALAAGLMLTGEHDGLEVWEEQNPAPYIIAELSANHNGSIERAFALIEAAKRSGADAIKLQTYTPDSMTIDHDGPGFVIEGGLWNGRKLYDLYHEAATPLDWHPRLFQKARNVGITCFSSPFDAQAVDFLESIGCCAYKIASFEIIDIPLIKRVAETGKPIIISTGMANLSEIEDAVEVTGPSPATLLYCVSSYPAKPDEMQLQGIGKLAAAVGRPVGLSDHSSGAEIAIASTALGAKMIEKHFTLRRADGGPDAAFSMEPAEFKAMADGVRNVHAALNSPAKIEARERTDEDRNRVLRRSLYVVADVRAGDKFTRENIRSIRPGFGLPPKYIGEIIGKTARHDVKRGTPLSWLHFD